MKKNEMRYITELTDYSMIKLACAFIIIALIVFIYTEKIIVLIANGLLALLLIFNNISGYMEYKKHEKIKKYGKKISATIVDFECRPFAKHSVAYSLDVKFFHPKYNQEIIFKTPEVSFHPIEELGDKKCNAYVYNDEIYISDFVSRMSDQPIILEDKKEYKKEATKVKIRHFFQRFKTNVLTTLLTLLLMSIIFLIIVYFK